MARKKAGLKIRARYVPNADGRERRRAQLEANSLYSAPDYVTARHLQALNPKVLAAISSCMKRVKKKLFPKKRSIFLDLHTIHYTLYPPEIK
ncbi:unnamed protein product [Arctia plantaginis]|uniref:Uncharacterized protein n=1 Tax=Arctia plantaginis TaxID=874455 RepID=A0A8S1A5D3_ARCPL|nr:unnamed protein product [Arctia plantaginis]